MCDKDLLVVFEGLDGSGKSTQLHLLNSALEDLEHHVLCVEEPGTTPLGIFLREELLLKRGSIRISPLAEAFLFNAARAQAMEEVFGGGVVLSDRSFWSTLAYQGYGHGLDLLELWSLCIIAVGGVIPDLTIIIDVPVEVCFNRKRSIRGSLDRMESKEAAFYVRVRNGYLDMSKRYQYNWLVVDGTKSVDEIHQEILRAVLPLLP